MACIDIRIQTRTKEEALEQRQGYFRKYHPAGYGTTISEPREQADGTWLAHGYRYSSCD